MQAIDMKQESCFDKVLSSMRGAHTSSAVMKGIRFALQIIVAIGVSSASAGPTESFFQSLVRDDGEEALEWVAHGVDPNSRDERGDPGMVAALKANSPSAAAALMRAPGIDLEAANRAGETPLMMAAIKGETQLCAQLIERGARVNQPGWTALHYAAAGNSLDAVRLLLERGAEVNAVSPTGRTPLMMAAGLANERVVNALIAAGADVDYLDKSGAGAVDAARGSGREWLAAKLQALRKTPRETGKLQPPAQ